MSRIDTNAIRSNLTNDSVQHIPSTVIDHLLNELDILRGGSAKTSDTQKDSPIKFQDEADRSPLLSKRPLFINPPVIINPASGELFLVSDRGTVFKMRKDGLSEVPIVDRVTVTKFDFEGICKAAIGGSPDVSREYTINLNRQLCTTSGRNVTGGSRFNIITSYDLGLEVDKTYQVTISEVTK